jgi:Tfp pilus assembly protein PilN
VDLASAQQETTRLHTVILKVQQFEQRKAQLQQRVQLIEQLRKGQTEPVHMLDQVSRALPPMLWLTELKQTGNDIVIDGKCMVLTSLSDFVGNLEASGYFKKSVEIVNSTPSRRRRAISSSSASKRSFNRRDEPAWATVRSCLMPHPERPDRPL